MGPFYNETDFQQISQLKLNLIRIPIGYWAFELPNDPYIQGQEKYLDLAIEWATKYNLFIQIEFMDYRVHKMGLIILDYILKLQHG